MVDLVGRTIGQYQIVERLGRGGMADVYKAFHPGLSLFRAIKVIRPEFVHESDFRARFQKEAQAVAALRHPNIVQVHDFGVDGDAFYMVMEFIEGQDLKKVIQQSKSAPSIAQAVEWVEQIASALEYAHSEHVLHRDIKPENIMLNTRGVPILTDFGIAKLLTPSTRLTQTGVGIGTPAYMAPEQARGDPDIGPAADIYSLSIVLYELLTGTTPYQADTPIAVMLKAINDPMPMPRAINAAISEPLQDVILHATRKDQAERTQTATEFLAELRGAVRPQSDADPDDTFVRSPTAVPGKAGTRRTAMLVAASAVAIVIAAIAILASRTSYVSNTPTPTAPATDVVEESLPTKPLATEPVPQPEPEPALDTQSAESVEASAPMPTASPPPVQEPQPSLSPVSFAGQYTGFEDGARYLLVLEEIATGQYRGALLSEDEPVMITASQQGARLVGQADEDGDSVAVSLVRGENGTIRLTDDEGHASVFRPIDPQEFAAPAFDGQPAYPGPEQYEAGGIMAVNGHRLNPDDVQRMVEMGFSAQPDHYWYDHISGAWGRAGGPTEGYLPAELPFPAIDPNASTGNTGVFINARELPLAELADLQTFTGPLQAGRYFIDGYGNFGIEGGPPAFNLNEAAARMGAPTWQPGQGWQP